MLTSRSARSIAIVVGGLASCLVALTVFALPAGSTTSTTSADDTPTVPLPAPSYPVNEHGLTYGSSADAISPETEPDLIHVVATNGLLGYVKKVDLDLADGTTAMEGFDSPQDAIEWQETEGQKDHAVPVYEVDGVTLIGEFVVVGQATVAEQQAANDAALQH